MENLYKEYGTSKSLEEAGIIVEPIDGIKFYCKRAGGSNKAYSEFLTRKLRPYLAKYNAGKKVPLDIINEINIEAFVDYCLIKWENVTDRSGVPLELTKENAVNLFTELPELYSVLIEDCQNVDNFKDEVKDIVGKF